MYNRFELFSRAKYQGDKLRSRYYQSTTHLRSINETNYVVRDRDVQLTCDFQRLMDTSPT